MKSKMRGAAISAVEILNINVHGVWIYVRGREHFLSHEDYPWFKEATIRKIQNVRLLHGHHLHWPDLDVDLEVESLEKPEHYPLKYREGR